MEQASSTHELIGTFVNAKMSVCVCGKELSLRELVRERVRVTFWACALLIRTVDLMICREAK